MTIECQEMMTDVFLRGWIAGLAVAFLILLLAGAFSE